MRVNHWRRIKHGGSGLKKERKSKDGERETRRLPGDAGLLFFNFININFNFKFNIFSYFFGRAGDGDEEGWEGGEEQQQAVGHTPRRGKRGENQGGEYLRNLKKDWV